MQTRRPTTSTPVTAPPVLQRRPLFSTRPFAPPSAQVAPAPQEAPAPGTPEAGYHFADIPVRGARSPLPPPAVPRAMSDTAGLAAPGPASPLPRVARPTPTGLPDRLKAGIEALSGYDLSDVRVHSSSSQPAQLQALAYTQGTDIHVAPGQEKHLAHEAWHVVQQKQGRVRPTLQGRGWRSMRMTDWKEKRIACACAPLHTKELYRHGWRRWRTRVTRSARYPRRITPATRRAGAA